MSEKHTRGPWVIAGDSADYIVTFAPVSKIGDGNVICSEPDFGMEASRANWPANARLIAAAPDLLDAARRVIATKDAFDAYARIPLPARAILLPPDRDAGNKAFNDLREAIAKATTQSEVG